MRRTRPNFRALILALLAATAVAPLDAAEWGAIRVAGREIWPGETKRFPYGGETSFEAAYIDAPVFVARGVRAGPSLCITAGIHGDEINGTEIARRAFSWVNPQDLRGTVIVFPMVNAVRSGNRYMQDRRDLNRAFPGTSNGSVTSIIAHTLFTELSRNCDYLIDLHTGSFSRSNHPQISVTGKNNRQLELARHFGVASSSSTKDPTAASAARPATSESPRSSMRPGEPSASTRPDRLWRAGHRKRDGPPRHDGGRQGDHRAGVTHLHPDHLGAGAHRRGRLFLSTASWASGAQGRPPRHHHRPLTDRYTAVSADQGSEVIGLAVAQIVLSGYALVHLGVQHR
jgi:hypothetical protein